MNPVDITLYGILDPEHCLDRDLAELAAIAADHGATILQYRDKISDTRHMVAAVSEIIEAVSHTDVPVIVNDRVDVAIALEANGLHIGQSDGDPAIIRQKIGPDMILGLSIEDDSQITKTPSNCVSYFGVGPIRATASKMDHAAPMGFDGLKRSIESTDVPCMAIGGLTADDMPALKACGCESVAIISAISRAADPQAAARAFVNVEPVT